MMNQTSPERVRQDSRLIGQTLLKLALPRLLLRAIVIAVALIIWYFVANWILDAGKRVSFEFLHSLGQPTMDMVQKFSPLWWVGVGIWSLIVFFALRAWLSASLASGRATPVQTEVLAELAPQLSDESLGVLRWTWGDREEPFTVGDLRRSLSEIRHSRIAKIDMVARQAEILEGGGKPAPAPATTTPRAANRAPTATSSRASAPPDKRHPSAQPARSRRPGGFCISVRCQQAAPILACHARATAGRASYRHHAPAARRGDRAAGLLESAFHVPYFRPVRRQHGAGLLGRPFVQRAGAGCLARQAHHLRRPVHRRRAMIWSPASSPRRSARR